jgi:short-subunit dehydrogenase
MTKSNRGVALITGASAGIGRATAEALRDAGYRVFGTSRKSDPQSFDGITMLTGDVTSDASVAKLVDDVLSEAGRIDLLVNNAGFGVTGAAEESSIAQVRSLFETNFYGVVRVSNAVLPIMRKQRGGRILNVGSVLGLVPAPYGAYYSASKFAIEGYSESLDHEVREFGVRVAIIEPGATRTSFEGSNVRGDRPLAAYDQTQAKYRVAFNQVMAAGDSAEEVAATIVRAARDKTPRLSYRSGKAARQSAFARRFLPRSLFDRILHKQFGLA